MNDLHITIPVTVDAALFRNFALFDTFNVKKRWKLPLIFAAIMLVSSLLCFSRYQAESQAVLIGSVLLTIGLGLPAIYFINFLWSIKTQIRRLGLNEPQFVYTVTLTEASDGIEVVTINGNTSRYDWSSIDGIYQRKNCIYLYVQSNHAYLLPDSNTAEQEEALKSLLKRMCPTFFTHY